MMQRICPICDQVMKHAHYCSACRSWVKEPVYMNVTYYLNERHPKNEEHCSYHTGEMQHAKAAFEKRNAMPWELENTRKSFQKNAVPDQPGKKIAEKTNPAKNRNRSAQTKSQTGAGESRPAVKKSNPVKILVLLYFAIVILSWFIKILGSLTGLLIGITGI